MDLNVLYCGDENVVDGIFLSALTLRDCHSDPLSVFILTASLETDQRIFRAISPNFARRLQYVLREKNPQSRVVLYDITDLFCADLPTANLSSRFTPLCTLRLFADLVDGLPDRILYSDTDVLCRGDCTDLFSFDLGGAEIAGVPDRYGKWFFGNILRHDYFNSGVLLLDLKKIRESGLFARCRALCREKEMFMPDQTALNKTATKRKLPKKFNEQGKIRSDTALKHFTTFFRFFPYFRSVTVKPWDEERLHSVLKISEFDGTLTRLREEKARIESESEPICGE